MSEATMGAKPNWANRIADAAVRGWFTSEDRDDANDWRKCAVGEKYGQEWLYAMQDVDALIDLGVQFMRAVCEDDVERAWKNYKAIQEVKTNAN